jgi:hypothetical protein
MSSALIKRHFVFDLCLYQLDDPSQARGSQAPTIRRRRKSPYRVTIDQRTCKFLFRGIQEQILSAFTAVISSPTRASTRFGP